MLDKSSVTKLRVFDTYISKLKEYLIEEGGTWVDGVFPTIDEAYNTAIKGRNVLMDKYYNESIGNIDDLFSIITSDNPVNYADYASPDHPEASEFLSNMKASYQRMLARNDMALTVNWAINYDPVSKLVILLDILFEADNASWDSSNETLLWLEHNLAYASKISFYSQYYPKVLKEALKGYERVETLEYSDEELKALAHAIVVLQKILSPLKGKLKRMSIDKTSMEAHEKNNKAAESFIGYQNQKHESVRARVIEDTYYLNDHASIDNSCIIYTNQHRIQPDGNQLVKRAGIHIDPDSGKVVYNRNMLLTAVDALAAERGYVSYYSTTSVVSLPELSNFITVEELPLSSEARNNIVNSNPGCEYILNIDRETGDWMYKYKITMPFVFNSIKDKYPEVVDEANSIGVKTRGVFASMSSASRLGQTFLYPYMEAVREIVLPDNIYYSHMAQWSHPDHLRQMFTDMAFAANPHLYDTYPLTTRTDKQEVTKLHDQLVSEGYTFIQSSDDKTGFDNMNSPLFQFAFSSCFLSYCFDMTEDDKRVLKFLMGGSLFPVVITPDGPTCYSVIIPSGQWCTSIEGTQSSNMGSLMNRYMLAGCLDINKKNLYRVKPDHNGEDDGTGFIVVDNVVIPSNPINEEIPESESDYNEE